MKEINRIAKSGYEHIGAIICDMLVCADCPVTNATPSGQLKYPECVDSLDAYIKTNELTINIQPEKE